VLREKKIEFVTANLDKNILLQMCLFLLAY